MLKRSLDQDNVHLHLHLLMHPNIPLHAHKYVLLLARAARKRLMASFKADSSDCSPTALTRTVTTAVSPVTRAPSTLAWAMAERHRAQKYREKRT